MQFTLKAEAFRAATRHRIDADMEASDDTRSMLTSSIAPEQMISRPLRCILVSRREQCGGRLFLKKIERLLTEGRSQLLSLTVYDGCCMINHRDYLSGTEGVVPPSANERGVINT